MVLAAGEGRRLRPLTERVPKALVEVGGRTLLDGALARLEPVVGAGPGSLAVNAHHHAQQVVDRVGSRAHVAVEQPVALGTAGAVAALAPWLAGRAALVTNADVWMPDGVQALTGLVTGWDGVRCRLLCRPAGGRRADFHGPDGAPLGYVGSCLLPPSLVAELVRRLVPSAGATPSPAGLHEVLWRDLAAGGELDLHVTDAVAVDCGTPADLDAARRAASGGDGRGRDTDHQGRSDDRP